MDKVEITPEMEEQMQIYGTVFVMDGKIVPIDSIRIETPTPSPTQEV